MVLFVDLEDESGNSSDPLDNDSMPHHWSHQLHIREGLGDLPARPSVQEVVERTNPNKNAMTEAMGCYPVIKAIASAIDLNALDSLSLTCRQIRANLLQFRKLLLTSTLHCCNEDLPPDPEHTFRYRARASDWYFVELGNGTGREAQGKAGSCARDMVAECRRCGTVVCRNCTIKPPAPVLLRHRHRRICSPCSSAPLATLTKIHLLASTSAKDETLKQEFCSCDSAGIWLCQPCGRSLRSADTDYERIWKWRTRYLPSLGGLGVGIGDGNRGVPCGRQHDCVAAREVEQEIDCDAEDAREIDAFANSANSSRAVTPGSSPSNRSATGSVNGSFGSGSGSMGPGYARHEIEGIGGVVKRKLVVMVKVGACVPEWEDEKEQGKFLVREAQGHARSWCGWCWRIVPGAKDMVE